LARSGFRSGGYPEAALRDADDALEDARDTGQAVTLLYALAFATLTNILYGNWVSLAAMAQEHLALAEEKNLSYWKVSAMMSQGTVLAVTGRASDAIDMLVPGIAAYRSMGSKFTLSVHLLSLARAHAELGQFDDAWNCISEARLARNRSDVAGAGSSKS
jgi:hypothetical protein